ncbi:hypothetical protein ABKN59_002367 [Abortiporus biennis]
MSIHPHVPTHLISSYSTLENALNTSSTGTGGTTSTTDMHTTESRKETSQQTVDAAKSGRNKSTNVTQGAPQQSH